jgi:hypothetical protein
LFLFSGSRCFSSSSQTNINLKEIMKKKILLLTSLLLCGCAGVNWPAVGASLITDVQDGTVAAADVYTAYQALNQNLTTNNVTTGKLTVGKVLAAAQAGATAVNTPGLAQAVNSLVTDAQATITKLKGTGATTPAIINAVSTQGAGTVSTVAALPTPVAP